MTTQREVIEAFIHDESAPNVASNLRRAQSADHPATEYLCGGRDGREVVIARRDPIQMLTVYQNFPYIGIRMRTTHVRRVARTVRSEIADTNVEDMQVTVHGRRDEEAPILGDDVEVDF
jgi:hypothetical protein